MSHHKFLLTSEPQFSLCCNLQSRAYAVNNQTIHFIMLGVRLMTWWTVLQGKECFGLTFLLMFNFCFSLRCKFSCCFCVGLFFPCFVSFSLLNKIYCYNKKNRKYLMRHQRRITNNERKHSSNQTCCFTQLCRFPAERGQSSTCTEEFLKKLRVSSSWVCMTPSCKL